MTRPDMDDLAETLRRIGRGPGHFTLKDSDLVVDEAAAIAWQFLLVSRRRGIRLPMEDSRIGYDAVAELFRGSPEFPVLVRNVELLLSRAGDEPARIALLFRYLVCKFVKNWCKKRFADEDPAGACIRRNITACRGEFDGKLPYKRGKRLHFLLPRAGIRETIPSSEHVDELWTPSISEWRIPRLLEDTRRILAERPHYASWVDIDQIVRDYLEVMTFKRLTSLRDTTIEDPDAVATLAQYQAFWTGKAIPTLERSFLSGTSLPAEVAERLLRAYKCWFVDLLQSGDRVGRFPYLADEIAGLTREEFRRKYRRIWDGLHRAGLDLLREWLWPEEVEEEEAAAAREELDPAVDGTGG